MKTAECSTRRLLGAWVPCAFLFLTVLSSKADSTWVYAVQITADVQISPPQLRLTWEADQYGANSYTIYRKAKTATSWGSPIATLSGTVTNYTDLNVTVGSTYEYQIIEASAIGTYTSYGYIYGGINAPLVDDRGRVILIVATNSTIGLSNELSRLQIDLIGDGWNVIRHDVSSNDTPASVRSLITADYNAVANVSAVFLFGHVPILQSGFIDYDTHGARPMPTDCYYGDVNGNWSSSPSYLPSDVELMVGRVDLANMPGNAAPGTWPSETELLRNYLNKDHNWRFKQITVQRRALMADRFGDYTGEARAATGYRNFTPFVGHGNTPPGGIGGIVQADISDTAPATNRWISLISSNTYLWTYGCGGGQDTSISELGLHGEYNDVWTTDIYSQDAHAVFFMLEGSWFGNWDHADNIMRSTLATPTMGLACCCIAGHPHWYMHHMGLGEPIGYGARLTMNNSTLYRSNTNEETRAIYITLLGDPTLRMEPVAPASGLNASASGGLATLNWTASADPVAGYHVYRASSPTGPFTRLTGSLLSATSFNETVPAGAYTYMVRAVALQTNPSGSYYNPSQGIFASVNVGNAPPPITVTASKVSNGIRLAWNTQAGATYRVLSKTSLTQPNWTDLSGTLTANGSTMAWTNGVSAGNPFALYRIATP